LHAPVDGDYSTGFVGCGRRPFGHESLVVSKCSCLYPSPVREISFTRGETIDDDDDDAMGVVVVPFRRKAWSHVYVHLDTV
jgi:hypothetical protein